MWTYRWYCDPTGPDPWRAWYDAQGGDVRGRHDIVFSFLEARNQWIEPHAKALDDGLIEVILKTKVQHRLLGFYWPKGLRHQFTFLLPCTHKDKVYEPPDALETAQKRKKELEKGSNWIKRCVRPE